MKKLFATLVVILAALSARAQVFILNENMMVDRLATIKATVVDSLSNEPIPYASFYVIPAKDTTISNFTLTDDKGVAKLEDVPLGNYTLHVEMMGYKPFVKTRYFRESEVEMGTIKLQQDEQFLKAAVVSDVGNPVVVRVYHRRTALPSPWKCSLWRARCCPWKRASFRGPQPG